MAKKNNKYIQITDNIRLITYDMGYEIQKYREKNAKKWMPVASFGWDMRAVLIGLFRHCVFDDKTASNIEELTELIKDVEKNLSDKALEIRKLNIDNKK